MPTQTIIIPLYNEASTLEKVMQEIIEQSPPGTNIVLVNDGSTDGSEKICQRWAQSGYLEKNKISMVEHPKNLGYGQALLSGFAEALKDPETAFFLTMDIDGQHLPSDILRFFQAPSNDLLSGSRYLADLQKNLEPPKERVKINHRINQNLGKLAQTELGQKFKITDSFCGMKRYSRRLLSDFLGYFEGLPEKEKTMRTGYGFPLAFWRFYFDWLKQDNGSFKQSFQEIAIARIYLSYERSFGGNLDQHLRRYRYYLKCLQAPKE